MDLSKVNEKPENVREQIEISVAAADERISDELFLKIFRASLVQHAEKQAAVWQPVIDELKAIEANEKI